MFPTGVASYVELLSGESSQTPELLFAPQLVNVCQPTHPLAEAVWVIKKTKIMDEREIQTEPTCFTSIFMVLLLASKPAYFFQRL
jgi:hypothetical protein